MQTQLKYVPYTHLQTAGQRLFEEDMVSVRVQFVPRISQTKDGDLVIRGFTQQNRAIDVVFSGDHIEASVPLVSKLRAQLSQAQSANGWQDADIDILRVTAQLEGTWRRRFSRDAEGWQTHTHLFYSVRCSLRAKTMGHTAA